MLHKLTKQNGYPQHLVVANRRGVFDLYAAHQLVVCGDWNGKKWKWA